MDVLFGIRNSWNNHFQHKASPCDNKLHNVLKASLYGYYDDIDRPVVFDKSRGWLPYIEFVENLIGQKMKILVPIRPIPEILASFEKLYRETSKFKQPPGEANHYFEFQTIKGRCDYWMRHDQVVGLTLNRLEDAIRRGFQDRMFFIDYNRLTNNPKRTMLEIYNFLGEEWFEHNFDNIEQVTHEDDNVHGYINLHKIRNKVIPAKACAEEILGRDVVSFYTQKGISS